jgi:regulator of RNase E activity RraA
MSGFVWGLAEETRLAALRDALARVSTATACQLMISQGWRNGYMIGLRPLQRLGLGVRLVGRARTCRYLPRRGPEGTHDPAARRISPEVVLIEATQPGDVFCVDALGVTTAGIIGDILTARLKANGALAAVIHGVVRDSPYIAEVELPVFSAGVHPSHSGRDLFAVEYDCPVNMAGAHVVPGDIILADDEGVLAMPLDLAEYIAAHGPAKEDLEMWIRSKILGGGSIHDYYPPSPAKIDEYERETGRSFEPPAERHRAGDQA